MSYEINPKKFKPIHKITGCLVESNGKIILLKRKESSLYGKKWGIPSGKVKEKENLKESMQRELKEETNININSKKFKIIKEYKVRHNPGYDFTYILFHIKISDKEIKLNEKEHDEALWISPPEALNLPLVPGTERCIQDFYKLPLN